MPSTRNTRTSQRRPSAAETAAEELLLVLSELGLTEIPRQLVREFLAEALADAGINNEGGPA